eukprot:TRINITY_DN12654_c0_g2_i1.p1 TRINITY_DN12654_c0_g2~~TRINITY_DN12654_c0_g2_i1.p1  ORF type:complete len:135 (-),score=10.22 TRINITY_DN12654_c0_g2_i1:56-460(-)
MRTAEAMRGVVACFSSRTGVAITDFEHCGNGSQALRHQNTTRTFSEDACQNRAKPVKAICTHLQQHNELSQHICRVTLLVYNRQTMRDPMSLCGCDAARQTHARRDAAIHSRHVDCNAKLHSPSWAAPPWTPSS